MKIWLALLLLTAAPAYGACRNATFEGAEYTVCEATSDQDVRLFLDDDQGQKYGGFDRLNEVLAGKLIFAMNAGMYLPDRRPVGLYVEDGRQLKKLITRDTSGNFGLLPNGVFCISERGFEVTESLTFKARGQSCTYASQSGPMLVIDGALHPKFLEGSSYTNIRNGVGVTDDGTKAYFVISDSYVNFWDFARFMRDGLGVTNALYFDGSISRLFAPELARDDLGFQMGPIVGLVAE